MKVSELIAQLQKLPQEKSVLCQVVPQEPPGAWNMHFDVQDVPGSWMVQLRVWHPDLKTMPEWNETPNAKVSRGAQAQAKTNDA